MNRTTQAASAAVGVFLPLMVVWPVSSPAQDPYRLQVDPACEKTLPVRVVRGMAGQADVTLVPRDPRIGAHGTCNYAIAGSDVILMVAVNPITDPSFYESYRRNCGSEHPPTAIPDLGEEALACHGYGGAGNHAVVVHKGRRVVVLEGTRRVDRRTRRLGTHVFTTEQLTDLARAVMGKL
jgi:hypothetical protein